MNSNLLLNIVCTENPSHSSKNSCMLEWLMCLVTAGGKGLGNAGREEARRTVNAGGGVGGVSAAMLSI